jgi:peptidoglycan/LPS O-acetylase OafA/YrhL
MNLLNDGIPGIPKIISPQQHRILDILTTGAFALAGALMWRSNRRAAIAALANGAFVAGFSMYTDYEGDGSKPISFATHGRLDEVQAGFAASAPTLFGFADEKKSWFFRGQAMNEVTVVALTNFPAAERSKRWDVAA